MRDHTKPRAFELADQLALTNSTPSPAGASPESKHRAVIATEVCTVVLEKWAKL